MSSYPHWVAPTTLSILFVIQILFILYIKNSISSNHYKWVDITVYALYLIVWIGVIVTSILMKEKFFFEVSPEREKCLKEQVNRNNFGAKRSCACCGKGTVGGIPPNYAEWLVPDADTGDLWKRPENVLVLPMDTFSNGEEAKCQTCGPPSYITYI
jgi:hypothetical protein